MIVRTQLADVLKGVAILLMIQVHIIELFASPEIYNSSVGNLLLFFGGVPVAPVFMIVFGYFIGCSQKSQKQLIGRGLKIIALGMILNIALNLNLIISVSRGLFAIDIWPYILGIDILQFAGVSLIVIALLKKWFTQSLSFLVTSIFIVIFLGQFLLKFKPDAIILQYVTALFYGSTQWSYFPIFPWLTYPLVGLAFFILTKKHGYTFQVALKTRWLMALLCVVFLAFTMHVAILQSANLSFYYHHNGLFTLWAIVFIAFYVFYLNELLASLGHLMIFKFIKWLGKNVTLIYVLQWMIIGNIATSIYKAISNPYVLIGAYFGILLAVCVLSYAILKLKSRLQPKL